MHVDVEVDPVLPQVETRVELDVHIWNGAELPMHVLFGPGKAATFPSAYPYA